MTKILLRIAGKIHAFFGVTAAAGIYLYFIQGTFSNQFNNRFPKNQ